MDGGVWADITNQMALHGFTDTGLDCVGQCAINCSNNNEICSFHTDGALVCTVDGSVRFMQQNLFIGVVAAIVTYRGGESVDAF